MARGQPLAYALTQELISNNAITADAQEVISAFLEKRAATWAGA
jgi:hypothetical protein